MKFSVLKLIKILFFIFFAIYFTSAFLALVIFWSAYHLAGVVVMLFYRFSEEDKNNDLKELSKKFNKQYRVNNLTYDLAQRVMSTKCVKERFKLFKEFLITGYKIYCEK